MCTRNRLFRVLGYFSLFAAFGAGAGAAARVIRLTGDDPHANAAELFPAAAQANRSIFYDKAGNARSVAGVYAIGDLIAGPSYWQQWGAANDGKGEPQQINSVSHGCSPARFRGVNVIQTD